MEYSDSINPATFAAAVQRTQQLCVERRAPLAELASIAVSESFCSCVTAGEDAAEHHLSGIHAELIAQFVARVQAANDVPRDRGNKDIGSAASVMTDVNTNASGSVQQRQAALSRWNNEGGADASAYHDAQADMTNAELVQLRVRVIALENLVIALLSEGSDRQIRVAREMAAYISPRPGFTHHPMTIRAATHMVEIAARAVHYREVAPS